MRLFASLSFSRDLLLLASPRVAHTRIETFEENPNSFPLSSHPRSVWHAPDPSSHEEDTHTHARTHTMMRVFVARTTNPRSSSLLSWWFPSPLVRNNAKGFAFVVLFAFAAFIKATNTIEFPLIKGAEAFAFPLHRSRHRDGGDGDDYDGGAGPNDRAVRERRRTHLERVRTTQRGLGRRRDEPGANKAFCWGL